MHQRGKPITAGEWGMLVFSLTNALWMLMFPVFEASKIGRDEVPLSEISWSLIYTVVTFLHLFAVGTRLMAIRVVAGMFSCVTVIYWLFFFGVRNYTTIAVPARITLAVIFTGVFIGLITNDE